MTSFRPERDMHFDYYFSVDILKALTDADETGPNLSLPSSDESARTLIRQGYEMAIRRFAGSFGFSYSPLAVQAQTSSEDPIALSE